MGINERKKREKERRRNEIIDAAEHVFYKKGVDQATMDEVAEKAELSKGTLYLYFKNKEALHYAILLRGMEIITNSFKKRFDENKNGVENLLEIGEAYIDFCNTNKKYFSIMMQFHSSRFEKVDEGQKMKMLEENSPFLHVSKILKKGQEDGSIRDDIPADELSLILWAQINGILEFTAHRTVLMDYYGLKASGVMQNQLKILLNGVQKQQL